MTACLPVSSRPLGLTICLAAILASPALIRPLAGQPEPPAGASPWGISSSAGSFRNHTEWLPTMAAAGVSTVRLFPEWGSIEPTRGNRTWDHADGLVKAAGENHIEINGILMGAPPGSKSSHAFPMKDLDGWSDYVGAVVKRYPQVRYWEVWNEGNGGFNDGHHTTADYAKLAAVSYAAGKKANARARIGLSVASFDAPYLNRAILAQARQGTPDHFDHLCVHPYEIADGLADPDGEVPFLWMTSTLRDILKQNAPDRANAEIWVTEVARRVEKRGEEEVTAADAARALVKMYTMGIAQGVARTQWFEAQDPIGEDQGFGLLARNGTPRPTYTAMKTLTRLLGRHPRYVGWLALGDNGKGYGFVFAAESPVLVAWLPAGEPETIISLPGAFLAVDPVSGGGTKLKDAAAVSLGQAPVIYTEIPARLVDQARANASKPFPWGGDYSAAKAVSARLGSPDGAKGVFQVNRRATPVITYPDGSTGILARGDQAVGFYCHPSFAGFGTTEYYVRATVRRVAPGNVGMNLHYEAADGQGRAPYKNRGIWFGVGPGTGWQTHTWHVTDASFCKMWGHDFALRPEQSVPFVIGQVEVRTVPFE